MLILITYIRPAVFAISAIVALLMYAWARATIPVVGLRDVWLTEGFAFSALVYLYFALLASPLYVAFPGAPLRILYIKARKAIGVSAFFFALLHEYFAFFKLLGGVSGLSALTPKYLVAISLGSTALLILSLMALTSLRFFILKLGTWWKPLHRFVYLAGVLIIVHALMLGRHFQDLSQAIPQIAFTALFFLLALEALRFHRYCTQKLTGQRYVSIAFFSIVAALAGIYFIIHIPGLAHVHLVRDAQSGIFTFSTDHDDENPSSASRASQFLGKHSWHLVLFGLPFAVVFGIEFRTRYRERKEKAL